MPEVDARFDQLFGGNISHENSLKTWHTG